MIFAVVQVVLSSIAAFGIFRLWRRVVAGSRAVFWLVTSGLLLRSIAGVLAFWISYLGLPVARSLQIGRGLWVFAIDARLYVEYALSVASRGLESILLVDKTLPSPFFIQTLAAAMLCFGSVVSVAILLNLAAYLGCCAIILSFGDAARRPAVFAIAALSLSPSTIVWSLQPLKDITFLFLVMAFFGAARVWQQLWRIETSGRQVLLGVLWSAVQAGLLYGISGIRWYFGAVILMVSVPFAVMTIIGASARMTAAAVSLLLLLPLSFAAFFAAAGPYIPQSIRKAVRTHSVKEQAAVPKMVLRTMTESRRGFDNAGGATIIGAGVAIRQIDAALAAPAPPPANAAKHHVAARPKHIATPPPKIVAVAAPPPPASPSRNVAPQPPPATAVAAPVSPPRNVTPQLPPATAVAVLASPPRNVAPQPPPTTAVAVPASPPRNVAPQLPPTTAVAVPASPPPRNVAPQLPPTTAVAVPVSPIARILAGTVAMVLPHSLAQRLGIVDVRGGRGFWLFVEVDTIVFDMVLAFAIFSIAVAGRRRTLGAPVFWLMLFVTGAIGVALAYTVSNFGTLFRYRGMLLVGLVLLPLAAVGPAGLEETREHSQVPIAD